MRTRSNSSTLVFVILAAVVAVGLGVGIVRLMNGMGSTTALTDNYPWGLWIIYDVFFVPFSAGAFMILAVAHIYNRHEYHAIARPVVLAGFLGEIMVVAVLVMDLGRWNQFYNVLFPWYWNVRSFMFQVSICLTIYLGIMVLEVAPAILERWNLQKLLRYIRPLTVLIAGVGIVLSSLHQSSLGSLFLLMPYKLHALWWTPLLPLLFFTSAVFSGLSMAILVAILSFRIFHRPLEIRLVADLARVASVILGLYFVLKVGDLLINGELSLLLSSGTLSLLFVIEMIVGVITPLILFGMPRFRESARGLIGGAASVLAGVLLNRTTIALWAQNVPGGATYIPSWMEVVVSIAAIAAGILLFGLAVCLLPILPADSKHKEHKPVGWRRQTTIPVAGVMIVLTPLVVIGLQPMVRVHAARVEPSPTPLVQSIRELEDCRDCHTSPAALTEAGAAQQDLRRLVVEPHDSSTPHGQLDCVTCHHGNGSAGDLESIHTRVIADPSMGDAEMCLACHHDLPEEFPQDRLRTPHDEVTHGQTTDVYCSDCHGGVGHGFDPVSGGVICSMTACIDCHRDRQLDSQLTDCDACHISPHEPIPAMDCNACHQSTDEWQGVEVGTHPVELVGKHAEVQCFDCHQQPDVTYECARCHHPPDAAHYGSACEECHTPTSFQEVNLPAHPVELVGAHQTVGCKECHVEGQATLAYVCSACHQRPENHASGECSACHTPEGWIESAVSLAPLVPHDIAGWEKCVICHDPAGQVRPAPASHADYNSEQCLGCHKTE
jgi:Ni/Fe-hydrogenase subunit HybB-like protein